MTPYPTSLDPEALPALFDAFSGKVPDPHRTVHLAYDTAGFAIGKLYPDAPTLKAALAAAKTQPVKADFKAAADAIDAHLKAHGGDRHRAAVAAKEVSAFPWKIVLPALLQLLMQLLPGFLG